VSGDQKEATEFDLVMPFVAGWECAQIDAALEHASSQHEGVVTWGPSVCAANLPQIELAMITTVRLRRDGYGICACGVRENSPGSAACA